MASLKYQILKRIDSLKNFGKKKKEAKQNQKLIDELMGIKTNSLRVNGIHSQKTCDDYKKHALDFANWERSKYPQKIFKDLDNIPRHHVGEWLQEGINAGESAYTTNIKSASLAKIMRCHSYDFNVKIPSRAKATVTRSRNDVKYDKHFSVANNKNVITFCEATGLRRSELEALTPEQIRFEGDRLIIDLKTEKVWRNSTKGGRGRYIYVIKTHYDIVLEAKKNAETMGQNKVFNSIHHAMDVHSYRREFARLKYQEILANIKARGEKIVNDYVCRDGSHRRFNKEALNEVAQNLGHNRLTVCVQSYL